MIQADIVLCVLLDALILTRFGVLRKLNAELANGRLAMFVTELQFRAIIAHHNVLIYNFCSLPFPRDASHNPSVQNLFSDCSNLACHLRPSSGCSFRRGCYGVLGSLVSSHGLVKHGLSRRNLSRASSLKLLWKHLKTDGWKTTFGRVS